MNEPGVPASAIDAARTAYAAGQLERTRQIVGRLLDEPTAPADPTRIEARRLYCGASFRLGQLHDAVDAGRALIEQVGTSSAHPARFDALTFLVVAWGELAEYDESMEALRSLLALAARGESLRDVVRARGSMATCFTLLGDPWAGQRVLGEVAQWLERLPGEAALEATVRTNHASIWLQIARLASEGGDAQGCAHAIVEAENALARAREVAAKLGDARVEAYADVHECEALLLRGDGARVLRIIRGALANADSAGLSADGRFLRLLEVDAHIRIAQPETALRALRALEVRHGAGQDYTSRIRQLTLLYAACAAMGDYPQALVHFEQASELKHLRSYRRAAAASRHLRLRLELEHLYKLTAAA